MSQPSPANGQVEKVELGFVPIAKLNEEERLVIGWSTVISKGGEPVIDKQGHYIDAEELERAYLDYALTARSGTDMHKGESVQTYVWGFPFTKAYQDMLGIDLGMEGFLGVWKVHDDEAWARVKAGDRPMLSIGGGALIEDMPDA